MVVKVVDGALASDNGLDEETEVCEHGKTAVLDLLDLHTPDKCSGQRHLWTYILQLVMTLDKILQQSFQPAA